MAKLPIDPVSIAKAFIAGYQATLPADSSINVDASSSGESGLGPNPQNSPLNQPWFGIQEGVNNNRMFAKERADTASGSAGGEAWMPPTLTPTQLVPFAKTPAGQALVAHIMQQIHTAKAKQGKKAYTPKH